MLVTLQTERVRTLDQVRAFVEGSEAVDFAGAERESVYEFVRRALVRSGYERLGKSDKGLVRRYTRADIRQLAAVDAALGQMSGPATRALMRRQYEVFGDERFERLAGLSNGHFCTTCAGARWWPGSGRRTAPSGNGASPSLTANPAMCESIPSIRATMTAPRASPTSTRSMR